MSKRGYLDDKWSDAKEFQVHGKIQCLGIGLKQRMMNLEAADSSSDEEEEISTTPAAAPATSHNTEEHLWQQQSEIQNQNAKVEALRKNIKNVRGNAGVALKALSTKNSKCSKEVGVNHGGKQGKVHPPSGFGVDSQCWDGKQVVLCGLVGACELNGRKGVVRGSIDIATSRYEVLPDPNPNLILNPESSIVHTNLT